MKSPQLLNIRGRQMSNTQLKQDLGFRPEKKWGKDEEWTKQASDGTKVSLLSAEGALTRAGHGNRPHRLLAECRCCGKMIPAGRMHQHYKSH